VLPQRYLVTGLSGFGVFRTSQPLR